MATGWIYCFSNEAMPGYWKVGVSEDDPASAADALLQASSVPMPFTLEFAKCIVNYAARFQVARTFLAKMGSRSPLNTDFFDCTLADVHMLFSLMDSAIDDDESITDFDATVSDDLGAMVARHVHSEGDLHPPTRKITLDSSSNVRRRSVVELKQQFSLLCALSDATQPQREVPRGIQYTASKQPHREVPQEPQREHRREPARESQGEPQREPTREPSAELMAPDSVPVPRMRKVSSTSLSDSPQPKATRMALEKPKAEEKEKEKSGLFTFSLRRLMSK